MDAYATHLEALVEAVLGSQGPILELGCGDYSTPVLSAVARHHGRKFRVQASNESWSAKFRDIADVEIVDWAHWRPAGEWGIVFLDSEEHTRERIERLPSLAAITRLVVLHDADASMQRSRWQACTAGWDVKLYTRYMPWTAVLRR